MFRRLLLTQIVRNAARRDFGDQFTIAEAQIIRAKLQVEMFKKVSLENDG
jgi:hypothetical protein